MSDDQTLADASSEVKALVSALYPWPATNEAAYWIVNEHMKELILSKRAYKLSHNVWKHVGTAALEALHAVIDKLGPSWAQVLPETTVLDVQYAFRKEEEVCGKNSSNSSAHQKKMSG